MTTLIKSATEQREDEVRLRRDLAMQLIDAGYRALETRVVARKARWRLGRVRDDLRRYAAKGGA
jgi:hypothetical protein